MWNKFTVWSSSKTLEVTEKDMKTLTRCYRPSCAAKWASGGVPALWRPDRRWCAALLAMLMGRILVCADGEWLHAPRQAPRLLTIRGGLSRESAKTSDMVFQAALAGSVWIHFSQTWKPMVEYLLTNLLVFTNILTFVQTFSNLILNIYRQTGVHTLISSICWKSAVRDGVQLCVGVDLCVNVF